MYPQNKAICSTLFAMILKIFKYIYTAPKSSFKPFQKKGGEVDAPKQ